MAEGILKRKSKEKGLKWQIDSAGTERFHVGEPPHELSQKVALAHGLDISAQRARQFRPRDFEDYDRIYVMAGDVYREVMAIGGSKADPSKTTLLLNEVYPESNRPVPDPWYGGEDGFQEAWRLIASACDKIIEKYS